MDEGTHRCCQHRACIDEDLHKLYAMLEESERPAEKDSTMVAVSINMEPMSPAVVGVDEVVGVDDGDAGDGPVMDKEEGGGGRRLRGSNPIARPPPQPRRHGLLLVVAALVLCAAQSPISQPLSAGAPIASPLLRLDADSLNPLSSPNPLPPSDLNPPPSLSLSPHSPTQSTAVLYPVPSPFRRARYEPSAGGSAAGATRASPPRAVSPPSTTAPPPPLSRPPSRASPDSSLDRDDLDPNPAVATTEALAKVDLSNDPDATATAKSGSSKPRQAARGGGCDVGKSLSYLYRACRIATLAVKHIDIAISILSRFMEPKKLASLAEF
ncbi:hypothetical protein TRIUR3_25567 [Triticum urartu]|uniref:Uncharacterized protein n=1 Tax=Triticum urartu TaxID=4572 RepID=M8AJA1_TRIUA|nr:hypothetical protein TRIUR3_25567 [Triticum urartu]